MASNAKFSEQNAVLFWDFDVSVRGSNTLTAVNSTAWIDMKKWNRITCLILRSVGTGKIQQAGLYVSTASAGTSPTAVTTTGSTTITGLPQAAAGTNLLSGEQGVGLHIIEASHDEIAAALSGGRYVSARISGATNADEYIVCYILSEPRYPHTGMIQSADGSASKAEWAE